MAIPLPKKVYLSNKRLFGNKNVPKKVVNEEPVLTVPLDSILNDFTKAELVKIGEGLGVKLDSGLRKSEMIDMLISSGKVKADKDYLSSLLE